VEQQHGGCTRRAVDGAHEGLAPARKVEVMAVWQLG